MLQKVNTLKKFPELKNDKVKNSLIELSKLFKKK